jgi:hypothetical protein
MIYSFLFFEWTRGGFIFNVYKKSIFPRYETAIKIKNIFHPEKLSALGL